MVKLQPRGWQGDVVYLGSLRGSRSYLNDIFEKKRQSGYSEAESKEKTWCIGPCAVYDYNLTLCRRQSRLQHIYHGQPFARVDLNPMPEPT